MSSGEGRDGVGERSTETSWSQWPTGPLSTEMFWPEAVTGAPEAVTGAPEAVTGAPEAVTGTPEAVTGTPDAVTGAPEVDEAAARAVRDAAAQPDWRSLERPNRRAPEDRGILRRTVPMVVVGLGWLAVVGYGALRFDLAWSLGALAAGVVAVALGLWGRSVIGLVPVLLGAAAWGMATGPEAPVSFSDLPGAALLIGWNALYAVPLLVTYALATRVEAPARAA